MHSDGHAVPAREGAADYRLRHSGMSWVVGPRLTGRSSLAKRASERVRRDCGWQGPLAQPRIQDQQCLALGCVVGLAKAATGLEEAAVASPTEAEASGELHVGSERVNMLERGTTKVKGVRNPATGAKYRPEPGEGHVNLQNDQGGNLHVIFPEP